MRFFEVVLSGAALIAAAWAVELNEVPSKLEAGKSYTITYSPKDNTPTTFILRKGDPNDLGTVGTIGTATGGSFTWTVPKDLPDNNYAFEIKQGDESNYSGLIPLTGGSGKDTSSSGSASATPSSSSTKSSASSTSASATTTTTQSTTSKASATGTGAMTTPGQNSTITSATLSRTTSTGGSSATTTPPSSPPPQTNAAAFFGSSPLALLVGAAAMVYFN